MPSDYENGLKKINDKLTENRTTLTYFVIQR